MSPDQIRTWIPRFEIMTRTRLRLFCFPYAGATAQALRPLTLALPAGVQGCSAQYPGQWSQGKASHSMEELISAGADCLAPLFDKPFAFLGYSMGALVAFELARHLRRQGRPQPAHLFVLSLRAPHKPALHAPLHRLQDVELIRQVNEMYGGVPEVILREPDLMRALIPMLRSDIKLYEKHRHTSEVPLLCGIDAFAGDRDKTLTREQVEAWSEQTSSSFTSRFYPCGHFILESHGAEVQRAVNARLEQMLVDSSIPKG